MVYSSSMIHCAAGEAHLHHAEQALGSRRRSARSGRLSSYSLPANLWKKPTWPNIGPMPPIWKCTHWIVCQRRAGIRGQQLAGLLREILQDRAGLEQRQRLAARTIGIEDRRDFAVRIEREEFRRLLVVLVEVDQVQLVRQPDLLQHDRHLDAVRRRQRIELQAVGMLRGPAFGDGEGGEIGHDDLFCDDRFRGRAACRLPRADGLIGETLEFEVERMPERHLALGHQHAGRIGLRTNPPMRAGDAAPLKFAL